MSLGEIASHVVVAVLMHQDVARTPGLRPRDFGVRAGDLIGKTVHGFA
ncbi:hypothetical protein DHOM_10745 [Dermabacter hominis 1368]|uniref:Uncharacterized protein n=1 Tax=Dermabacter hominis 1368 TaxID=1450519 RepID=A0ABR4SH15_9MICO|nr:hypothetical protein DHOM_10745 [Dermabacter hominis 1368]